MNPFSYRVRLVVGGANFCLFLLMILVGLNACKSNAVADEVNAKFPVVRYLLGVAASGNKKLPPLTLTKANKVKEVRDCAGFVKSIVSWDVQEGVNNMRVASDYQPCVARAIFAQARPSRKSAFRKNFSALIYHRLDLTSFPSSLHNRTEKTKWSLSALGMKVHKKSETSVILSPAGWHYRFDLLAKGDFNRDGNEDLLVRFIDQATGGNYYAVEILVLTKMKTKDVWDAREGISFLRARGKSG